MLNDKNIEFVFQGEKGTALVWVIDGECLYDLPLSNFHANIFLSATDIIDVSSEYLNNDGITVRFLRDGEVLEDFNTSEYFGSILLSSPQVLNLKDYPYGKYVESPHARFDGEKFIILNQDVSNKQP